MAQADPRATEAEAARHATGQARSLSATMPRLILEARRVAATVIHGLHGRRRAGTGENFWQFRRFMSGEPAARVDWRRLAPLLAGGLLGVPVGSWLLPHIPLTAFKIAVGTVLIGYSVFMLIAAGRIQLRAGGRAAEAVVGLAAGVLGGMAGLSGALPTVWATLKGWPKEERRIVFQAFNTTVLSAMLVATIAQGLVGPRLLLALALSLPATLIGGRLGAWLYHRLDDRRRGEREDRADAAEQQPAGEHGADRERRVHVHRSSSELRPEHVVLELLVRDQEQQHPQRFHRTRLQCDEHREDHRDVRPDGRDELRHDADPQTQRERVGHAEREQERPRDQRRHHGLDAA